MNQLNLTPPTLCSISQCKIDLDFQPLTHWPEGLPAVAINGWVLAGFSQKLVFNHHFDETDADGVSQLFRSLYNELSFIEIVRLWKKVAATPWFPFDKIAEAYHFRHNEQFDKMAAIITQLPFEFQNWCASKKLGLSDLLPLVSAEKINLTPVFEKIISAKLSKADGVLALEYCVDLLLMGKPHLEILGEVSNSWLIHLKALRFPYATAKDKAAEGKVSQLPWPGTSQVKWARHGDKAGIEVKLFVSQPADLKKYAKSFEKIQDLLENNQGDLWKEQ